MATTDAPVIAEFRLDHPLLRSALTTVPDMRLSWEDTTPIDDDRTRILLWAEGGDFEAFEAAVDGDPTVTPPERSVQFGDRRLYQFQVIGEGDEPTIYPVIVEQGTIIHRFTGTHEGWECRCTFPSETEFAFFRDTCAEEGIDLTLHSRYEQQPTTSPFAPNLTDRQQELLLTALEAGYFEIPREASLAEVGEQVGITGNAASQRLRRGMRTLVEQFQMDLDPSRRPE